MRLTLHIGPHKTGTTALQSSFAGGARTLSSHGVLYPKCNWMYPAQHLLAFAMKDRTVPGSNKALCRDQELRALKQTLDRPSVNQVFLSSEEFFSAPREAIEWLKDGLDLTDINILTFLRRPDQFLISCYNQKVRQVGNGFDAPIRRFLRNPSAIAPEINFNTHLSNWADVFGEAAITLATYEADRPLARTLAHLGLPPDALPDPPNVNQSPPGAVIETMRHAKLAGLSERDQRKILKLAMQVFDAKTPFAVANEDRLNIIRHFEADNERLFKRFGQCNPYSVKNFQPIQNFADLNITIGDVMRLVAQLI